MVNVGSLDSSAEGIRQIGGVFNKARASVLLSRAAQVPARRENKLTDEEAATGQIGFRFEVA